MKCKFLLCIFNKNFECVLREVEIGERGECESCILARLPIEEIEKFKEEPLMKLEKTYKTPTK